MAKNKVKTIGMFKIEQGMEKMVPLPGSKMLRLTMGTGQQKDEVMGIKIKEGAKEYEMPPHLAIQVAKILETIDRTKIFVCGYHGSWYEGTARRTPPACPQCHAVAIDASSRMIETSGAFEEDDA